MAPGRSAFHGFNSDVSFKNQTYHVQTESMGDETRPTINTLVYNKGVLLRKISRSCTDLAEPPGPAEIEERVKKQHLDTLARIKRGDFSDHP